MTPTTQQFLVRDSLAVISLTAIAIVLFGITLFLFRSFEARRAQLARDWANRGLAALRAKRPAEAVTAYRTALSYAPGDRNDEFMLAEALGEAGRIDESFNYFMGLWQTRPGEGLINLEMARLAARQQNTQAAINYYRAAMVGTWEGDAIERRRAVRLELARYLIQQRELGQAKTELLIAGGNAPDLPDLDMTVGGLLEQADDPSDALAYYQKAVKDRPRDAGALGAAGRLAFHLGEYSQARDSLRRAVREQPDNRKIAALLAQSERILQLIPAEDLPVRERVRRILAARTIAEQRMSACSALPEDLTARWAGPDGTAAASALRTDPDIQKSVLQLVYDTEIVASHRCSAATGDDALLLLLARSSAQIRETSHQH
ncbi:MAG TPA: tetratricopeptide repeat protein [Bryobacteraceae bacterium]|nr:tetratricopeptide repeat protein [Bryobacteraceae bacterium]